MATGTLPYCNKTIAAIIKTFLRVGYIGHITEHFCAVGMSCFNHFFWISKGRNIKRHFLFYTHR